jgi:hypothetical protein
MPEPEDCERIIEWASLRIQAHVGKRAFSEAIFLCELIEAYSEAYLIAGIIIGNTPASQWLARRISDTYYLSEKLKNLDYNGQILENELVGLLMPIKDFLETNQNITSEMSEKPGSEDQIPAGYKNLD